MWNNICNKNDLEGLMNSFGNFHDSCIKEFKYVSGAYVSKNLSMQPINMERRPRVIFQRQDTNPSAIEIEFIGLNHMCIYPVNGEYTCEILSAAMKFYEEKIYWYDGENDINRNDDKGTVICSTSARWRAVDEYIGSDEVYTKAQG